jgi:RNA polymerase sigma-70 factor (ECF subfamily)
VQETLLRAWRHPESLDPRRGSVRAWLFTTARKLAIDAWLGAPQERRTPTSCGARRGGRRQSAVRRDGRRALAGPARPTVRCWSVFYQGRSVAEAAARLGCRQTVDPAPNAVTTVGLAEMG